MSDTKKLANEILDRHKEAFELKAKLSDAINGHPMSDILPAFIMVYTEVLMNCCNSEEEASNLATNFAARTIMAIKSFSEEGLCSWNSNGTLQ